MRISLPSWSPRGNGSEPERVLDRLEALDAQLHELERQRASLAERERGLEQRERALAGVEAERVAALERATSLSAEQARRELVAEIEGEARRRAGRVLHQIDRRTREEAEERARTILAAATQRLAANHVERTTTDAIRLPNEEMKGRIIGRDGRNIQALENLTGVDILVDDRPLEVRVSSFDGERREVARLTLEWLVADGRIHPASCEAAFERARAELRRRMVADGEKVAAETGVDGLHPSLVELLGRLRYRTSHGQNLLAHVAEAARLADLIATELGGRADVARRAALLHDVGKAAGAEIGGGHASAGAQLARRYGESEAVAHAIEAHHGQVEPRTVEAVVVQTADALSGARPGARGDNREVYVARLRELEALALRHTGVLRVHAMRAGREIRVMVDPGAVDDARAALISHEIATEVERELRHSGQVKVTVIRESRATSYAR